MEVDNDHKLQQQQDLTRKTCRGVDVLLYTMVC